MNAKSILLILVVLMMGSTPVTATELYVISTQRNSMVKANADTHGDVTPWFANGNCGVTPGWLETSNDKASLFVAAHNWGAGTITQVSAADGSLVATIDNNLTNGRGVVQDAAGDLYGIQRDGAIYKYDASSSWAKTLIHAAGADGMNSIAGSLDIGPDGNLYTLQVPVGSAGTVKKLALDGTFLGDFKVLPGPGVYPFMLEWGPNGNLFVATGNQKSVQEFNSAGTLVYEYTHASFGPFPTGGIGFHPTTGNLFVSCGGATTAAQAVHEFNTTTGAYVGLFSDDAAWPGYFQQLGDIEIIPDIPTRFMDRTSQLGLGDLSTGHDETIAWGDYNKDGYPDMLTSSKLWRNNSGLNFSLIATKGRGAWGDYNNDGLIDIYAWEGNKVYRNEPNSDIFTTISMPPLPEQHPGSTCWVDYDNDSFIDLYIPGSEAASTFWPDVILKNNQASSFSIAWEQISGFLPARGVAACDFDEDADMDIYLSHYRQRPNILWVNDGNGVFQDEATAYGVAGDNPPVAPSVIPYGHTIGSAWGDMDNDGHFDLFVANLNHHDTRWSDESKFLRNRGPSGGYTFELMDELDGDDWRQGYACPTLGDYDNDGDLDLYVTVVPDYGGHSVLFRNDGSWNFTNVTAAEGLSNVNDGYQAAWADYDGDGDLDLLANLKMYENTTVNNNHWLKVRVTGDGVTVNGAAIGAQVRIDLGSAILTRQVGATTGQGNQNDLTLHFGLGDRTAPVDLEISWPDGTTSTIEDVAVDQLFYVGGVYEPACGDIFHQYPDGDVNKDCYVNWKDIQTLAENWTKCTDPEEPCGHTP